MPWYSLNGFGDVSSSVTSSTLDLCATSLISGELNTEESPVGVHFRLGGSSPVAASKWGQTARDKTAEAVLEVTKPSKMAFTPEYADPWDPDTGDDERPSVIAIKGRVSMEGAPGVPGRTP